MAVSVICPGPVSTPLLADMTLHRAEAITADEAADRIVAGLAADTFLITTHPHVMNLFRQKAANPEAYVEGLARFRNRVLTAR